MTAHIPQDHALPSQEAVDLVVALQRCLSHFHAHHDEPSILGQSQLQAEALTRYIDSRRARNMILGQGLFSDPAWDLMLLLLRAEMSREPMTLDKLSETSRLAMGMVLRHVGALERRGIVMNPSGPSAGGRRRVSLTPVAVDGMMSWFHLAFGQGMDAAARS